MRITANEDQKMSLTLSVRNSNDSGPGTPGFGPADPDVTKLKKAVEEENLGMLNEILKGGVNVNHKEGAFAETTLHKAVMKCWEDGVQVLLCHGAKVFTKNQFGQTPLHYAAASGSASCTRLLLLDKTGGVTQALNHRDMRGRTPLHDAAEQKTPDISKMLIKSGAEVDVRDSEMETPLHKAVKAKSCTMPVLVALLNGGASITAKDNHGDSVLSYILRRIPGGMEALYDHSLVTNTGNLSSKTLEVKFNFVSCISSTETNQMKCLQSIVEYGHAKLLKHPLCEVFLHTKWLKMKKFFYIQFAYYFLHAILTTVLTFDKMLETSCHNGTSTGESNTLLNDGARTTFMVIVLAMSSINIIQLISSTVYLSSFRRFFVLNLLHFIICILIFIVIPIDLKVNRYIQHLASILQLLLWIQCMFLVGRLPSCGIYVVMFTRVLGVFFKIFLVYSFLLVAFVFSFYISEYRPEQCKTATAVFLTFIQTLTMMIGELDYDQDFVENLDYLPGTSHIIFILFVILVAIILSNLLVALAVSDVQSLRNSAHLERLIKMMELVFSMEQGFRHMAYTMRRVKLSRLAKYLDRVPHYDVKTTFVTMAPYDPQKSNYLTLVLRTDLACYRRHEKVSIGMVNSVLDCLRHRDVSHSRKASTKPARIQRLRSVEYSDHGDISELKDYMKDVCERLSELLLSTSALNERMTKLEAEVKHKRPFPSQQPLRNQLHLSHLSSDGHLGTLNRARSNIVRECRSAEPQPARDEGVVLRHMPDRNGKRDGEGDEHEV